MVAFPPCKINLGLRILSKRADGYHNIETCFHTVPWTDILEIIKSDRFSFTSTGLVIAGDEKDNLCVKAYQLLHHDFGLTPVKIHLHKVVPMGAGLGGGSSDAAFTLRLLNDLFSLQLSFAQLSAYAARLGSDCAYFLQDKPMMGSGRGEILTPLMVDISAYYLVVVKPAVHVATAEAYQGVTPDDHGPSLFQLLKQPVTSWRDTLSNQFETSVFQKFPQIKSVKDKLYDQGAIYASMSGSGAAVFGLFEKPVSLQSEFPDCDYWAGGW